MKNILITGANGELASAIIDELLKRNEFVIDFIFYHMFYQKKKGDTTK